MTRFASVCLAVCLSFVMVQSASATEGAGPYLQSETSGCKIAYEGFQNHEPLPEFTYHFEGGAWGGKLCLNGFMPPEGEFLSDVVPVVAQYGATEVYQELESLHGESTRPLEDCWPQTIGFDDVNEDDVPDLLFMIACYDGERDMKAYDNMVYLSGEQNGRVEWHYEPLTHYVSELSDYEEFAIAAETEAPVRFEPPPPPADVVTQPMVDAAVDWWRKAIFFRGSSFYLYDKAADSTDAGYPQALSTWSGIWNDGLDAAVNWGNGKVYLFKGAQYLRYDANNQMVDAGYPKAINERTWPGVWQNGVDAVLNWGNGKAYFFKGSQYIRYDMAADRTDSGYPRNIDQNTWPGLWPQGVDAAVNWGNGKAYFFRGSEYVRYDVQSGKPDNGYPKPISGSTWPGLER